MYWNIYGYVLWMVMKVVSIVASSSGRLTLDRLKFSSTAKSRQMWNGISD